MKKTLTLLLLFAAIACKAQTDSTKVYVLGAINGKQILLQPSVYEFEADSLNQTNTALVIGTDTAKGSVYEIGGYLHILSATGTAGLQVRYTYTDETGVRVSKGTLSATTANSNSMYLSISPIPIDVLPGTIITFSMIYSGQSTVKVKYNVSWQARRIR